CLAFPSIAHVVCGSFQELSPCEVISPLQLFSSRRVLLWIFLCFLVFGCFFPYQSHRDIWQVDVALEASEIDSDTIVITCLPSSPPPPRHAVVMRSLSILSFIRVRFDDVLLVGA
ncbi:unnamed protein product, partial [Ectocarpus fasciculatus]